MSGKMRGHKLEKLTETGTRLSQQSEGQQSKAVDAHSGIFPRRDPMAQVASGTKNQASADVHASVLDGATAGRTSRAERSLLRLQRQYGNRYVQRVLAIARKEDRDAQAAPEVEQAIQQARGGGQALDSGVRAQMEPAFGADFSGVRVHAEAGADTLNRSLNARAFTTGQDIFFRQGAYNPGSAGGRELLAHELTHVVQQNSDQVRHKLAVGQPGDRYEHEADQVARAMMQREQQPIQKDTDEEPVQRQVEEEEEEKLIQAGAEESRIKRQAEEEEEEEPIQTKAEDGWVQRQVEEEKEEEPIQTKAKDAWVQRQMEDEEEEEPIQTKVEDVQVQRQAEEDEEEPIQTRAEDVLVQRQLEEEEEEPIQTKAESVRLQGQNQKRKDESVLAESIAAPTFSAPRPDRLSQSVPFSWLIQRAEIDDFRMPDEYAAHLDSLHGEALLRERGYQFDTWLADVVEHEARFLGIERRLDMSHAIKNVVRPWAEAIESIRIERDAEATSRAAILKGAGSTLLGYIPYVGPILSKIFDLATDSMSSSTPPVANLPVHAENAFQNVNRSHIEREESQLETFMRDQIVNQVTNDEFARLVQSEKGEDIRAVLNIPRPDVWEFERKFRESFALRRYVAEAAEHILTDAEQDILLRRGTVPRRRSYELEHGISRIQFDGSHWRVSIITFESEWGTPEVGTREAQWARRGRPRRFSRFMDAYRLATGIGVGGRSHGQRIIGAPTQVEFPHSLGAIIALSRGDSSLVYVQNNNLIRTICNHVVPGIARAPNFLPASLALTREAISGSLEPWQPMFQITGSIQTSTLPWEWFVGSLQGAFTQILVGYVETGGPERPIGTGQLIVMVNGRRTSVSSGAYRALRDIVLREVSVP